jgi:hypothetical protein
VTERPPPATWPDAILRVRRLLQRLAVPDPALGRVLDAVEAHTERLGTRSAVTDVAPFGGLGGAAPAARGRDAGGPRPKHAHASVLPAPPPTRGASAYVAPATAVPRAVPVAAPKAEAAVRAVPSAAAIPVLPVGGARPRAPLRAVAAGGSRAAASPRTSLPPQASSPRPAEAVAAAAKTAGSGLGAAATPGPVGTSPIAPAVAPSEAAQAATVDFAAVAAGALEAARAAAASAGSATRRRSPVAFPAAAVAGAGEDRSASVGSAARVDAVGRAVPVSTSSGSPGRSHSLQPLASVSSDRARPASLSQEATAPESSPDASAPARARSAPAFVFDPLEPRRGNDATADQLAERVAEVLREQAWREGVDLT